MNFVYFSNGIVFLGISALMAALAALYLATREVFLLSALVAGLIGGLVSLAVSHRVTDLRRLHTFLLTGSIWIAGAPAGALTLLLWWQFSPNDAFFEACSGVFAFVVLFSLPLT